MINDEIVRRLQGLLHDDVCPDNKDWLESDVLGRVEMLIEAYENIKGEVEALQDMLDFKLAKAARAYMGSLFE
jgi:hypothetical protein